MSDPDPVTQHLRALRDGDEAAADQLIPYVYEELRRLAGHLFRDQRASHTLQPTSLVHEAYLKLVRGPEAYESRGHFFRVAALAMRQLLVDYARERGRGKRGGDRQRVVLTPDAAAEGGVELDLLALNEALTELARLDERQARVVELRFLVGLTLEETAEALGVSERTVRYDWRMARLWLEQRLAGDD